MEEVKEEETITIYEAVARLKAREKDSKILDSFLNLKAGTK